MNKIISTNPGDNYSVVGSVEISNSDEISQKVKKAHGAEKVWKNYGIKKRIELLQKICDEFAKRKEELATLIMQETGKPIQQTVREARWYTEGFQWFLDHAASALKDEITQEDSTSRHRIVYEPQGVAAVITPWNFPYGMAVWGVVPNLLAGNTVVFKISEECPLVGKLIEEVFLNHDLPEGVFAEVYGAGDVGKKLSESDIDLIWFTGSTLVGKALYKTAAEKFIKVLLEMGGSNPCVVFDDVDIKKSAAIVYTGRFQNCGQVCNAIKRLIVHKSIANSMIDALQEVLTSKTLGDPKDETTDLGALVAKRQVDLLKSQVDDALAKGAKILYQKKVANNLKGAYYPPTLLGNIKKDMRVWKEEVFGPVLPVMTFVTEQEAIDLANDTSYGLGSRVFSKDKKRAERVASQIQAGTVEVNEGDRWLLCNPFGGYKNSGMGREHGAMGFQELCQVKLISESK